MEKMQLLFFFITFQFRDQSASSSRNEPENNLESLTEKNKQISNILSKIEDISQTSISLEQGPKEVVIPQKVAAWGDRRQKGEMRKMVTFTGPVSGVAFYNWPVSYSVDIA